MMQDDTTKKAMARLKRIEGQVRGLQKMIDADRYCIDVLTQTAAVVSALHGVEDLIMHRHLNTCLAEAMQSGDSLEKQRKIDEVMDILSKFRR